MSTYHFNRFALVTQVDDKIFVNATPAVRVTFEARHKPIVDFFTKSKSFTHEQALKLIAPSRLKELLDKRVFLPEAANDDEGRYSRQMGYFSITRSNPIEAQSALAKAHVLILGAGAVGSHTCWNLAAMGVGKLTILDFDVVEESNLNRQLMYTPKNLGELKVEVLRERLAEFNPTIELFALNRKIHSAADVRDVLGKLGQVDLIVKAIDSPDDSMDFVNEVSVSDRIPYVTGGFVDFVGVVGPNYIPDHSCCFACFRDFQQSKRLHGTGPTFAPLTAMVASMVAMISHKILLGEPESVANKVFSYNTLNSNWHTEISQPTRECPACGRKPLTAEADSQEIRPITWYRLGLVAMMATTLVLRQMFDQTLIGVLTLLMLMLSIPVLHAICQHDPTRTRREFFTNACLYIAVSLIAVSLDAFTAGQIQLPKHLPDVFVAMRAVIAWISQGVIGVTALFFLQSAVLTFFPRLVAFLQSDLNEELPHEAQS